MASTLKISPSVLTLNDVKPGEEVTRKVVLRADEPFNITDVKCRTKAFRVVEPKRGTKKTHFLEVTYTGEENEGRSEAELTFFTSLGDAPSGKLKAIVQVTAEEDAVVNAR